jgi:hypothetical protein
LITAIKREIEVGSCWFSSGLSCNNYGRLWKITAAAVWVSKSDDFELDPPSTNPPASPFSKSSSIPFTTLKPRVAGLVINAPSKLGSYKGVITFAGVMMEPINWMYGSQLITANYGVGPKGQPKASS